jgi:hypothetical protein
MGNIPKADAATQYRDTSAPNPTDIMGQMHDLLDSLETVALNQNLPMLAHLIGLAKSEAQSKHGKN